MKRWLLVRDGCPICRRSYLNGVVEKKIQEEQVIGGVVDEGERDLESGGGDRNAMLLSLPRSRNEL